MNAEDARRECEKKSTQSPIIDGETGMAGLSALFGDPEVCKLQDEVRELKARIVGYERDVKGMMETHTKVVKELEQAKRESYHRLENARNMEQENLKLHERLREAQERCERYERLIDYWMDNQ